MTAENKRFHKKTLLLANIRHYRFPYIMTFVILSCACFAVSCALFLSGAVTKGVSSLKDCVGADMIIIPEGSGNLSQDALFAGTPCTLMLDKKYADEIKKLPCVTESASRIYLATLKGQTCCASETQLIATDVENDFLLRKQTGGTVPDENEIILGSDYELSPGDEIMYFGENFTVKQVLPETGSGYDKSCFISLDAADKIMKKKEYADLFGGHDAGNSVSMIFLKTTDVDEAAYLIDMFYGDTGLSFLTFDNKMTELEHAARDIKTLSFAMSASICTMCLLFLFTLFTVFLSGRRREAGCLRSLHFSWNEIFMLYLSEGLFVAVPAVLSGWGVSILFLFSFWNAVSGWFESPMVRPCPDIFIPAVMLGFAFLFLFLSVGINIFRLGRNTVAELVKGD